ncbi:helix-turn-helix domain-containing protein [Amycolatopsis cihanbeyliensis]|uniref:NACHT domain-containing protein n=1 Tax=Amycolatopsis cihanbeyliensis TaxID=1128664 RepID=A0A542DD42_AMYCI|nr:helix-turn-helix domain-containing protein [Amycolatopsis cihanbeyliensis]TQJ00994.1 NACHT domain-containing protein [Amycolatopsis cihanbeyliensis]
MANRFGVLLRDARRRAGLTQDELAARSGVGVRTIRRLETGSGTDPRVGTVTLLADALDVTPDERRNLLAAADGKQPRQEPPEPAPSPTAAGPAPVEGEARSVPAPGGLPAVPPEVSEAADHLARVMAARLRRAEELRRVHDPFPLPVRWRQAPEHLADHWDNICRVPAGVTAAPLDLSGEVGDIASAYRRVPSRRLVVLGRAGSGKTVLALRFVLDTLAAREPGGAVPVIFDIGSWDPTATPLRTWLVERLQRDQPGLAAAAPGGATLAAVLVDTGRVLPVLDGFDEIAEGLHRPALETLNSLSTPLVLTSRFAEYQRAVTVVDVLTSAAVVELTDLTPDDLAGYLPRTARRGTADGGSGTTWDAVLSALRDPDNAEASPPANLAAVLTTPLMVGLARTVYSDSRDRDPTDLLDATRFPTPRAVEEHLLDTFVPTVYGGQAASARDGGTRRSWEVDRVRRWLGFLADDLDRRGTGDLEWWRMGGSLRRSSRVLLVAAFACVAAALVDWLVFSPVNALVSGTPLHGHVVLVDGLVIGPVVGVPFGLLYLLVVVRRGRMPEPTRVRVRLLDRSGRQPGFRRKVVARFAAGVLGGVVAGVGYALAATVVKVLSPNWTYAVDAGVLVRVTLVDAGVYALVFGLACGVVLALAAVLEAPANLTTATSPGDLLAANRATALRLACGLALALALAIAFGGFAAIGAVQAIADPLPWDLHWNLETGLLLGLMGGMSAGLAYIVTFTAWGQWLLFTRFRLPLVGRLPWAVNALLDDAYRRGVLRRSGAVYQFRHARLQEHLAKAYRAGR